MGYSPFIPWSGGGAAARRSLRSAVGKCSVWAGRPPPHLFLRHPPPVAVYVHRAAHKPVGHRHGGEGLAAQAVPSEVPEDEVEQLGGQTSPVQRGQHGCKAEKVL